MQDYYLDSTQDFQNKYGSLAGATAAWYTWSMLGMGDKFLETGQWALPGLRKLGLQHDMLKTGDVVRRNGSAFGDAIGFKFRGATAAGMFSMGAARALGAVNIEATLTSPGWYVAQVVGTAMKAGPLAPAVLVGGAVFGAAWFGGGAMLGNAARSMKKNQYVDMGSGFVDNQRTYTSRQRAVRAIAESHLQARSVIGNEAQLYHHSGG